jgi:hypothetical protein
MFQPVRIATVDLAVIGEEFPALTNMLDGFNGTLGVCAFSSRVFVISPQGIPIWTIQYLHLAKNRQYLPPT